MEDQILVVGINHRTAPVEIRERVTAGLATEDISRNLDMLKRDGFFDEFMVVSTCNRIEFVVVSRESAEVIKAINNLLCEASGRYLSYEMVYTHEGLDAVRHLFRVASGLDSMVMGEPQILGQIKGAYREATQRRTVGVILNRLMHKTFSVAKRVRTETGIGCRAVSVSYAAVELAKKIFGSLRDKRVLLIGAGEMAELAAEHFMRNGASHLIIANRTVERAIELAKRFRASTIPFSHISNAFETVDVVLSSTGSVNPIIKKEDIKAFMRKRRYRPLFLIDIAVPRDIDPKVNELDNVYLYDIDDLQEVIEWNKEERRREAEKAEHIIEEETIKFHRWLQTLDVFPTIIAMRRKAEEIRLTELSKTFSHLPHLSEDDKKAIIKLTEAIVKKVLHDPIMFMKRKASRPSKEFYVDLVQQVFNLPMGDDRRAHNLKLPEVGCSNLRIDTNTTAMASEGGNIHPFKKD
ncbi:MAG: glutamyl-tRNA reductase [Syntrophobacterales bacterium]|nr:glutamyl-tRNA reductase [Syntrophobacterales bacterium]